VCNDCGCAQAVNDEAWQSEAEQIYRDYTIYHQSKGAEQSVFDQASGQAISRSARLLERLRSEVSLPANGRLMDIGCGNGALLRAFSQMAPQWSMVGVEVNDHYRSEVEGIRGVEKLFTGSPADVPGRFQMISLMHALEHIPSPREFILKLWDKLEVGGWLLIQVPDCGRNPFMFQVADHASHFFAPTLKELVESAGYEVGVAAQDWVSKEITVLAHKAGPTSKVRPMLATFGNIARVTTRLSWLGQVIKIAVALSEKGKFGLFGTSIAANWLFGELDGRVDFFVDEDPHRAGQEMLGRRIFSPSEVPPSSHIFIALPTGMAEKLNSRICQSGSGNCYVLPPPFLDDEHD